MAYVMMDSIGGYTASQVSGVTPNVTTGDIRGDIFTVLGDTPATNTEAGTLKHWDWTSNVYVEVGISYNGSNNTGKIVDISYTPNRQYAGWSGLAYSSLKSDFVYFIDEENHLATACFCVRLNGIDYTHVDGWTAPAYRAELYNLIKSIEPPSYYISNGGGATHIAKVTGQLKDLSSNLSDILLVSGGGGGGLLVGEDAYAGADAGGISGSGSNSGNQSSGYAFGQGESGSGVSGGGGGFYGGYKGVSA